MKNDRKRKPGRKTARKDGEPQASGSIIRLPAPAARPIQVKHLEAPPKFIRRERIHPRRILPRVIEGKEREFHSATRQVVFHPPRALTAIARAAADDLTLVTNTELAEPGRQQLASNVDEPSVAVNGQVVLYTGNWYAGVSADGGQTFQYIDPFTSFPDPANLGFCCDQSANYIAAIDTFVWLLQYGPKSGPEADNIQRLAFAKTADVVAGRWRLFDITTQSLGVPGQFLDFPDLAVGVNSLYVTTNLFTPDGRSAGAAVVRIPVAGIDSGHVTAQPFISTDLNSFRVAQNSGSTAYFAAHVDTSTLRVFAWDENQGAPRPTDVGVARWITGNGYQSRTPDGRSWLDRADSRITGATLAGTELYFAWAVDAGSNQRPKPFVQIARIDSQNLTLLENINVFDPDSATCYGALSSNADNEVGISYMLGGGPRFPSHVVGILTGTRKDVIVAVGDRGPLPNPSNGSGEWGDYLTVRPIFPDRKLFAATGYTMNGKGDGSNRDATPRFVVFGRASDASAVQPMRKIPAKRPPTPPPTPPIPPGPLPPTPSADGGPITDVNTLPTVSPEVAQRIKAAAELGAGPAPRQAAPKAKIPVPKVLDQPGTERWRVKTGQDPDRAKVGKNVIEGNDLGAGIVEATLEELTGLPRPPGVADPNQDAPLFQDARAGVTEITIWRIEATIIALKHEPDGDYHIVMQGASGAMMVAEIPTPTRQFVGDSPWLANIGGARHEVDDKLVKKLSPADFALLDNRLVPRGAVTFQPHLAADTELSFHTPPEGSGAIQPLFSVQITPTTARITGVGFFDRSHGVSGAAPNVIELHPVLKVEWL